MKKIAIHAKFKENQMVEGMTVFNSNKVDTKKQQMFFGAPLGVQRYDSYKYPDFDKLTQTQLGFETDFQLSSLC